MPERPRGLDVVGFVSVLPLVVIFPGCLLIISLGDVIPMAVNQYWATTELNPRMDGGACTSKIDKYPATEGEGFEALLTWAFLSHSLMFSIADVSQFSRLHDQVPRSE